MENKRKHEERTMNENTVTILAHGDVLPDRPSPEYLFELVLPTLKQADILFGQLEAPLSDKGEPQLHMAPVRKVPADRVSALAAAGYDILSLAGNHHLDRGEAAFFETLDVLAKNKIAAVGAGKNIEEARKPVIFERKGIKIGFLAYCSVLPKGYDAKPDKSGCAPLRATTFYEQIDWQPGTPPRIVTQADKNDMAAMVEDIKKLRPQVDILFVSMHWGVHYVPGVIAMYQKEAGYAALDAGADLILGHHAHILKGIEVYKGKVIFYSMCNLVMPNVPGRKGSMGHSHYNIKDDPEYPDYTFPVDSRKTMIAKILVSGKKIERVSFLPVWINKHAQPEVLPRSDKRSDEVLSYMEWCCQSQGLNAKLTRDGDEIVVT
jgi:poly-gamma-glutamate capsule biosynthesis protein CapA/YwtB (metallophosphatase superfamily)